jgi:hypothetical protein
MSGVIRSILMVEFGSLSGVDAFFSVANTTPFVACRLLVGVHRQEFGDHHL